MSIGKVFKPTQQHPELPRAGSVPRTPRVLPVALWPQEPQQEPLASWAAEEPPPLSNPSGTRAGTWQKRLESLGEGMGGKPTRGQAMDSISRPPLINPATKGRQPRAAPASSVPRGGLEPPGLPRLLLELRAAPPRHCQGTHTRPYQEGLTNRPAHPPQPRNSRTGANRQEKEERCR